MSSLSLLPSPLVKRRANTQCFSLHRTSSDSYWIPATIELANCSPVVTLIGHCILASWETSSNLCGSIASIGNGVPPREIGSSLFLLTLGKMVASLILAFLTWYFSFAYSSILVSAPQGAFLFSACALSLMLLYWIDASAVVASRIQFLISRDDNEVVPFGPP